MKAINCQNCGASDFINLNGKTICTYCHTEYRISNSKYRHRKFFSITISLFAIVILSLLKYVQPFYLQQAKEPASPSTEIQNENTKILKRATSCHQFLLQNKNIALQTKRSLLTTILPNFKGGIWKNLIKSKSPKPIFQKTTSIWHTVREIFLRLSSRTWGVSLLISKKILMVILTLFTWQLGVQESYLQKAMSQSSSSTTILRIIS